MNQFRTTRPNVCAIAFVLSLAPIGLVGSACGKTEPDVVRPDSDSGASEDGGTAKDGGSEASNDASSAPCEGQPSICLDEHTMRVFVQGKRNDSGVCEYEIADVPCDRTGMPPDCLDGTCRVVIVR